jgi:hypothetical protein
MHINLFLRMALIPHNGHPGLIDKTVDRMFDPITVSIDNQDVGPLMALEAHDDMIGSELVAAIIDKR